MKNSSLWMGILSAACLIAGCEGDSAGRPAGNIIIMQKHVQGPAAPAGNSGRPDGVAAAPIDQPKPAVQPQPVVRPQLSVQPQPAAQPNYDSHPGSNSVQQSGLLLTLTVPETRLISGNTVVPELTVKNTTDKKITIPAVGSSPVFARIYRKTINFWDEVKHYPQTGTVVMNNWELGPGQEKKFSLTLPVEPDWPTSEPLKLTMELNGLPKAAPAVDIWITPDR
ncbi:MAG: hypothetical protein HZA50_02895 [Planctomycetes bacterium]|nr:hypothetical protein [Planctomycetota bacterium]